MIPKIIHKTGPFKDISLFNEHYTNIFHNNSKLSKDYEVRFRNDEGCLEDIKFFDKETNYLYEIENCYNDLIPTAYKADVWRMCILYLYGGIYSDFPHQYVVDINEIIDHNKEIVLCEDVNDNFIQISFLACIPKHHLILEVIKKQSYNIKNRIYTDTMLSITGPGCFGFVFKNYKFNSKIINEYKQYEDGYIRKKSNKKNIIKTRQLRDSKIFSKLNGRIHYSKLWFSKIVYFTDLPKKYRDENKEKIIEKINNDKLQIYFTFYWKFEKLLVILIFFSLTSIIFCLPLYKINLLVLILFTNLCIYILDMLIRYISNRLL